MAVLRLNGSRGSKSWELVASNSRASRLAGDSVEGFLNLPISGALRAGKSRKNRGNLSRGAWSRGTRALWGTFARTPSKGLRLCWRFPRILSIRLHCDSVRRRVGAQASDAAATGDRIAARSDVRLDAGDPVARRSRHAGVYAGDQRGARYSRFLDRAVAERDRTFSGSTRIPTIGSWCGRAARWRPAMEGSNNLTRA